MPGLRRPVAGARAARAESLLHIAIESSPNGLCIFDKDLRVVISNSHFAEMYGMDPAQTRPGTRLRDILDGRVAASCCPSDAAEYVSDSQRKARSRETVDSIDELRNGNIIAVSRHPMRDGGLIEVHRDITDARLAEARAEAARQELIEKQYAIDQAVIVAITDLRGRITYANDNFCKISGYSRLELLGQDHRILNSGTHSKELFRDMYRCIGRGELWRGELCNKSKSGSLYWVDTVITPQLGIDGKPIAYMAIRIDITARKHAEAQISHAATHDALTGLANRAALLERMNAALAHMGEQPGGVLTVHILDLDGFKQVNDTLGHAAGDNLLKELASRLKSSLGETDMVARLGGDEFAIIQIATGDQREAAIELAVKTLELVATPFQLEAQEVSVGTSFGIALAPANGTDAAELLKKADLALYRVKSEGRNSFSFFDEDLSAKAITRLQLVNDMRAALSRNEFELHYQPLFDTRTSRPCGMEALVRWRHPVAGLLYPDSFIGIAEETGLMEPLGQWILQRACADAACWPEDIKVAVNLSAGQFRTGTLFDVILCALVESGLPPERLELEIESLLLQDKESNVRVIQQLKNIGITIALDDFGTGYASLSYLLSFPFDKIKIDKSFTQGLLTRTDCMAVVASILTLARGLDIAVTAEGVETNPQFEQLRAQGVDYVQGYLLGRPRPLAELDFSALELIAQADEAA